MRRIKLRNGEKIGVAKSGRHITGAWVRGRFYENKTSLTSKGKKLITSGFKFRGVNYVRIRRR